MKHTSRGLLIYITEFRCKHKGGEHLGLKIKEEILHVESLVGENTAQTVLQTTLDLSSSAPSIGRVVWVKGTAVISDAAAASDKVNLDGYIDLTLIYAAEDFDEGPASYQVIPYRQAIAFSDYVEVIGAEEGMRVSTKIDLLGIEWELQSDQRAVSVDVLVQLTAEVKQQSRIQAVTSASVKPPRKLAVDDGVFTVRSLFKPVFTSLGVNQELSLPESAEPIHFILDCQPKPIILETVINQEQITLTGNLNVNLIYLDENGSIHSNAFKNVFPFTVSVPNETKITDLAVEPEVTAEIKTVLSPSSGSFTLTGDLRFKVALFESKQVRIVFDLAGSGGCVVETRTEPVMLDHLVNEKTQQASAQGVLELSGSYPPIREIVGSEGRVVNYDFRVDDDKVFVEGSISLEFAYLAHIEDEHKPLYWAAFNNAVPFQQVIAIGGVQPGMIADLEIEVTDLNLDLINRETIEVDVTYRSRLKVTEPVQREIVVEAIEVPPLEEDPPTVTYVFVNETDTLWKLSRQYHTSLEAILEANSWLREREQMRLLPRDKLCIPRKVW